MHNGFNFNKKNLIDNVKLLIDNDRIIDLKPGEEEYISYKNDNYIGHIIIYYFSFLMFLFLKVLFLHYVHLIYFSFYS